MAIRVRNQPEKRFTIAGTQLFSGGHAEAKGKRPTMEDRCTIIGQFAGENTQYYGIFDGHGGGDCSTFVASNLHTLIAQKLADKVDIFDAIQDSIDELNATAIEKWQCQGTTVAIAIIIGNMLYTANVGDSRIVLVNSDGTEQRLSVDHKASDPIEQDLIKSRTGFIQNDRVAGILALSRAMGDGSLSSFISCEAYMTENEFSHDQGLIIACDGVWDVLTDREAAKIYRDAEDAANAARQIKQAAIDNLSSDNVVVVCVNLLPKALQQNKEE